MDKNQSLMLATAAFGIIALLHLLRSVFSWPASIANWNVPVWFSYIFVVAAGYLSWHMYSASKKA